MHWYVYVEHQAYGPYSDEQMRGFVQEGRVSTASLISSAPESGFYGAGEFEAFGLWCAPRQSAVQPMMATGTGGHQAVQNQYVPQVNPQIAHQAAAAQPTPVEHAPEPQIEPVVRPVTQTMQQSAAQTILGQSRVYLIMAEIRSEGEMAFLKGMQNFAQSPAHTQRLSDTTWLLRSDVSAEQIRNVVSQTLNRQDRLFIIDCSAAKPAWFNIGTDLDHRIRQLWDEDET